MTLASSPISSGPLSGGPIIIGSEIPEEFFREGPHVVLAAEIVREKEKTSEGSIICAVVPAWDEIIHILNEDPNLIFEFSKQPRKFEELIAAAYQRAGWDEVTLTPRSGDEGRDVIAVKNGFGSIRFLEQTKAYREGRLVTHDEVSAMLGVSLTDTNTSKVLVTTTSDFQPEILSGERFKRLMPHRLELKNGSQLLQWLRTITSPGAK